MSDSVEIDGVKMFAKGDMVVLAASRHQENLFEPESVSHWVKAAEKAAEDDNGFVIDIGAYTGFYSVKAAQQGCRVMSFEPNKVVFDRMIENLYANGIEIFNAIIPFERGVASEKKEMLLYDKPDTPLTSASTFYPDSPSSKPAYTCTCIPVDPLLDVAEKTVYAIKVDVEGGEVDALFGCDTILLVHKPMIIAEFLNLEAKNNLIDFLKFYGYNEFYVCDERNLVAYA